MSSYGINPLGVGAVLPLALGGVIIGIVSNVLFCILLAFFLVMVVGITVFRRKVKISKLSVYVNSVYKKCELSCSL